MRPIVFVLAFLFFAVTTTIFAQSPTPTFTPSGTLPTSTVPATSTLPATSTIPATATIPATQVICGSPVVETPYYGDLLWEPRKDAYLAGEEITFRFAQPLLGCFLDHWLVNGDVVFHDPANEIVGPCYTPTPYPTEPPLPPQSTRAPGAPAPTAIVYPTLIPTAVPTSAAYPAPGNPYPAPVRASSGYEICERRPFIVLTMPSSCALSVSSGGAICPTSDFDKAETPPPNAFPTATAIIAPLSPPTQIPEPLTLSLLGMGVAGVAGYAFIRRKK